MLSVMNSNNFELERKDHIAPEGKSQPKTRVSSGVVVAEGTRVSGDNDVDRTVSSEGSFEARVPMGLDNRAPESDFNDLESNGSGRTKIANDFSVEDHYRRKGLENRVKFGVSEYDAMLSMFDEYAANGKVKVTGSKEPYSVGHGYEMGDMVWGKVKSHPWWPGHIYDEVFASSSVRRSKRKGLVLVAFFGDSSYGWFDPDELLPFETYFAEKSKQTNSKAFIKAVEEAVDEASRRRGLGLACRCRNPYNFQPASVQGYFAVDVADNEPAAVYSTFQIKRARDGFRAKDSLNFMKQLALMPRRDGHGNLEFIKDKAAVLAYRRAVYEKFDETYAQAFGQPAVRLTVKSKQSSMQSVIAPLSGPMVIAETLSKKKTHTRTVKTMDRANKDKYIFKQRDEVKELKSQQTGQATTPTQLGFVEVSSELTEGNYILQRRFPPAPLDQQTPAKVLAEQATAIEDKPPAVNGFLVKSSPSYGDRFSDPTKGIVSLRLKDEEVKFCSDQDQKYSVTSDFGKGRPTSFHGQDSKINIERERKKAKSLKRPAGDSGADKSVTGEKKKKRRKESGMDMSSDHMHKLGPAGKEGVPVGKGKHVKPDVERQETEDQDGDSLPNLARKKEFKLADLLGDLHYLALNPFHGRERNSPAFIRQAFLKFRSLVFQKSLGVSSPIEEELNENHAHRSPPSSSFSSDKIHSGIKDIRSSKPPKSIARLEDPTKGGQKRGPSNRQEELTAKRLKKIHDMRSLSAEKKTAMRTPEVQGEEKASLVLRPQKSVRVEPGKKMEAQPKVREPTMLVMRFPPDSTLPSENELKARMARFGPLDHNQARIFWNSLTCRVVFMYKADADAAHRYLSGNNNVFGSIRPRCHTRPFEAPAPYDLESKPQRDGGPTETAGESRSSSAHPTAQIKSCLKKPAAVESGPTSGKGTARVKFMLGEGEQLESKNNFNNTSFSDGHISATFTTTATTITTTAYGMDFNSRNFQQKIIPQNHPVSNFHSTPQASSQLPNPPINFHHPQKAAKNTSNFNKDMAGPSSANTDVAREMLSLMTRCNDVVTDLKSLLGYAPYHPL